jgi:serine/threonine-protein kinase
MIMEYVEGDTLAQKLEHGAFAPGDALNYTGQVLTALSYAHGKGIIHRDIKPSNMMLTPQGIVKLMDFGIARSTTDLGMTVTGTTMGSLDYMSPEQVKSEPTDARSDLYSVGVSLYEMVTGHRMFSATSSYSVMEAHVKETPRAPIELQPSMPKALSDIIMMAVAKEPGQRFQTADAFRNALSQVVVTSAAAAGATPVSQARTITTPAPVVATPAPMPPPLPTPAPQVAATPPGAYAPTPQPVRGSRHVGWILVAAIVVLVALFGGSQVYRSHKQNAAVESSMPTTTTVTTPAPSPTATQPEAPAPAQPNVDSAAPPANAMATAAPPPAHKTAPSSANVAPPQPADNGPSPEEIAAQKKLMDDMERQADQLDSRAAAVESSLGALEQQMHQSGLGLRGDIVESRANLRNDMAKAKQALDGMDTDRAQRFLSQADHELDKLEAFVGRR